MTGDFKSSDKFSIIVDSGATAMMMPFRQCFISYKDTPHSYVILANNQKSPCLGRGAICINMGGHNIILKDVLHVPSLRCPLFSVRCHRRFLGCSFLADNSGTFLSFPSFIIPVDDSTDCVVSGHSAPTNQLIHFDARVAGCTCAVSDNTRHRASRRPIVSSKTVTFSKDTVFKLKDPTILNEQPPSEAVNGSVDINNNLPLPIPTIVDNNNLSSSPSDSLGDNTFLDSSEDSSNVFKSLGLDPSDFTTSHLSPKQVKQLSQACVDALTNNGCISMDLIRFVQTILRRRSFSTSTSTTPDDRPSLLPCDKVPSFYPNKSTFYYS